MRVAEVLQGRLVRTKESLINQARPARHICVGVCSEGQKEGLFLLWKPHFFAGWPERPGESRIRKLCSRSRSECLPPAMPHSFFFYPWDPTVNVKAWIFVPAAQACSYADRPRPAGPRPPFLCGGGVA